MGVVDIVVALFIKISIVVAHLVLKIIRTPIGISRVLRIARVIRIRPDIHCFGYGLSFFEQLNSTMQRGNILILND